MKAIIFSGPSLPPTSITIEGPEWRPPLRQGDLYRAALEDPTALGVIDGFFDTTPTVWHEEILFALDRGIAVHGAASIGALRAAELDVFGMRGIGVIYEWFRDEKLQDDDEVAVLSAPAELGYQPLSEPMVNIRATVERVMSRRLINAEIGRLIVDLAKSMFFKQRTWDAVYASLRQHLSHQEVTELERILTINYVDQKRADAILLLQTIKELV
ncbi:TfuA-like protein [Microvirga arabica]|uniref:TfuA-like protein n=1 Tax=Microvirga arabica TaxID=1128671 RepID=UPI00193987B7|nr:TfuA-like protein [Microvirga arabica]MBM1174363.1 antibiotic resistance protein [Microvirga arabica]